MVQKKKKKNFFFFLQDGFEDFKTYVLENKSLIGITNINDMSAYDIENMHNIAFLNVTGLFDEFDLNFYRKKSKQKKSKGLLYIFSLLLYNIVF
jgi:hypothetical protein